VGLFRGVCHIPGSLLSSGIHRVNLLAVKDRSRIVYRHEDLLSFEVLDLQPRQEGWFGKGSGVVSPVLKCTIEYIGNEF
jgi:hypothetical protein